MPQPRGKSLPWGERLLVQIAQQFHCPSIGVQAQAQVLVRKITSFICSAGIALRRQDMLTTLRLMHFYHDSMGGQHGDGFHSMVDPRLR